MPELAAEASAASPANGTMATGMRCAPARVISIESCARATGISAGTNDTRTATARLGRRHCKRHPPDLVLRTRSLLVLRPRAKFRPALNEVRRLGVGEGG